MNSADKRKQLLSPLFWFVILVWCEEPMPNIYPWYFYDLISDLFLLNYVVYFGASANGKTKTAKQLHYVEKNIAFFLQLSFRKPGFGGLF